MSVAIRLNGDAAEVEAGLSLAELLSRLGVEARGVVVEQNGRIRRADELAAVAVETGDEIEVVRLVGGG